MSIVIDEEVKYTHAHTQPNTHNLKLQLDVQSTVISALLAPQNMYELLSYEKKMKAHIIYGTNVQLVIRLGRINQQICSHFFAMVSYL